MTTSTASSTRPRACAWAAEPRRHAAPGADVFREPRRQRAGPQLPGRPAGFRGRHERQGAGAGHDQHALHRAHRPVQRQRILAARDRLLRRASAADPPLLHRHRVRRRDQQPRRPSRNTNLLVRKPDWDIKVSKTGFINEAGECLVMLARINGRDLAIVLLDSQGKLSRMATRYASAASCRAKSRWRRPARRLRPAQSPDTEGRSDDRALSSGSGGRASPGAAAARPPARLGVERADRHRRVQRNATLGLQQLVAQAAHAQEGREIGRLAAVFDQLVVGRSMSCVTRMPSRPAISSSTCQNNCSSRRLVATVQAQRTGFRRMDCSLARMKISHMGAPDARDGTACHSGGDARRPMYDDRHGSGKALPGPVPTPAS